MWKHNEKPMAGYYNIENEKGQIIGRFSDENEAELGASAPELLNQLNKIQQWLWLDLLDPDKPINRDSAAKALKEISKLINPLLGV